MKKLPPLTQFPYPGLRPFTRYESDIFFGRDEHTRELLKKLKETHFIAVLGESGHGKSSLVNTGLVSSIQAGFLDSAKIRWRVAQLHPGEKPLTNLATELKKAFAPTGEEESSPPSESSLPDEKYIIKLRNPSWYLPEGTCLLLLVDQFEEIFTHTSSTHKNTKTFVTELLRASQLSNVYVVISMQSEYLGKCAQFHNLVEAINQGSFLVPRLTHEQLREAIEYPARIFFGKVESSLVDRLVADFVDDPDQLPLMQHALMRMWNKAVAEKKTEIKLTLNHYKDIGEKNALSKHAEELYNKLTSKQQEIAEVLFRNLTDRDDYDNLCRSPVRLDKVAPLAEVSGEVVAEVVKVFCHGTDETDKPNFIKPCENLATETILELSHASLIRYWPLLKQWAEADAEDKELYLRLEKDAIAYHDYEEKLKQHQGWNQLKGNSNTSSTSKVPVLWQGNDLNKALEWQERMGNAAEHWVKRYHKKQSQEFDQPSFKKTINFLKRSKEKHGGNTPKEQVQQGVAKKIESLKSKWTTTTEKFTRGIIWWLFGSVAFVISVFMFAKSFEITTGILSIIIWGTLVFLSYKAFEHYDRYKELKGTTTKSKGLKVKKPK
ncbi:MAG: hypothetical protein BWK78_04535 [Thiotrichaceae bacterium IS1]|nr:MAG: hypothetical protein BWK78_04535 [Thiotrichaceae bacterium IS1]